jgi:hypothetical protein
VATEELHIRWKVSRAHPRPEVAVLVDGVPDGHVEGGQDSEAVGAACAVEALKALLGLPHQGRVSVPALVEEGP